MKSTRATELERLESTVAWPSLVELALADPPNPRPLAEAINHWGRAFRVAYGGAPLEPDFPAAVRAFYRRLAAADFTPELLDWIDAFQCKHDRLPKPNDIPRELRAMLPSGKPNGRPRSDTRRWQAARRAWLAVQLTESYEARREIIEHLGERFSSVFGFTPMDVRDARPHELALEKLSEETGLSASRLQDLMGHRRRK